jgi:hypothetical protein
MPVLDILERDGVLRWDTPGILEAAIYFPREQDRRAEYEARWRAEHKGLLPPGKRLTKATTHGPAKRFGGKRLEANRAALRKLRVKIERVGTLLWLQAVLSQIDSPNATESKADYVMGELDKQGGIKTSRSTLRRDRVTHRGVVHWCAALAYQRRVFGAPFPCHPLIGPPDYSPYEALWDFLRLGHQFFEFADDSGCFSATPSFHRDRDLWEPPAGIAGVAPKRRNTWPNCHRVRADVIPGADVHAALETYDSTQYRT